MADDVTIRVGSQDNTAPDLDALKARLDELSHRAVTASVGVDDKQANLELDLVNAKLAETGKKVARPNIDVAGMLRAQATLDALDLQLDEIGHKDVSPKVTVDPGIKGLLKGIFSAAGNDITSLLGKSVSDGIEDGAQEGGSLLENVLSMPGVGLAVVGSITAAVGAAAAFIAQALAGSVVLGLGAGLAGLGIYAASKLKPVQDAFDKLKSAANDDLTQIGKPFGPVLVGLLGTATKVLGELTKPFTDAEKTIAKPFQELGTTLEQSFASPAVKTAIGAVATSFAAIAKAITPQVGTDVKNIASGITNVANAVAAHPQGFADFIRFLTLLVTWALDFISALTRVAGWLENEWKHAVQAAADVVGALVSSYKDDERDIETIWTRLTSDAKTLWHDITGAFTDLRNDVKTAWDDVESDTKRIWGDILTWMKGLPGNVVSALASLGNLLLSLTTTAWTKFWNGAKNVWGDILTWVKGRPSAIINGLTGLGTDLYNWAHDAFTKFLNGAKAIWGDVTSWVASLPGKILSALGIHSPPDWAIDAGKHIMTGILEGMLHGSGSLEQQVKSTATKAGQAAAKASGGGGGAGLHPTGSGATVEALMKSMAASVGWTGNLWTDLYNVEMREAGFNIHAQNPNSAAYGLAQFINGPSEYYQYGGNPNTAAGQITAMLNYIKDRYRTPAAAWAHEESAGWYGAGGATTAGLAMVGEHGRELLSLPGGSHVYSNPDTERMLAGGGAANVNITFAGGGTPVEQLFLQVLRKIVRVQGGGSVQKALGYGS